MACKAKSFRIGVNGSSSQRHKQRIAACEAGSLLSVESKIQNCSIPDGHGAEVPMANGIYDLFP
jgi:hypothetical protein